MSIFQELFGVGLPVIQAPMAGVQGSALAVAVAEAGALGSLPCALLNAEQMRAELSTVQARTRRPINVNFFCHSQPEPAHARETAWRTALQPYYDEFGLPPTAQRGVERKPFDEAAASVVEDFRPAVVSFHFGLPSPGLVARLKACGCKILASATTVREALWLESRGVDAIIAQGAEAGGHRGMFLTDDLTTQAGTFALLPQIVRAVKLPVIAAGGVADAAGTAVCLALGAAGVQVGTAYLLCPETTTSAIHRAALRSEAAAHTAVTNVFTGRPARGIVNRVIRELGPISELAPPFPLAASALAPLRAKAESLGDGGFSPLWCGQNASGCMELPAAEVTRRLAP